jgi:hypothetical protein
MKNLDTILQNLLCSSMPELIGRKIEEASDGFDIDTLAVSNHQEFNDCISRFIGHIYENGLVFAKILDSRTSLSEAISLLEQHYENQGTSGYDAAYLDAIDESGKGIQFVLRGLTELVKTLEVSRWLESYYASIIDPVDKGQHLKIIIDLVKKYPIHFPDNIREGNPARFINYYQDLIELVVSVEKLSAQLAGLGRNLGPN